MLAITDQTTGQNWRKLLRKPMGILGEKYIGWKVSIFFVQNSNLSTLSSIFYDHYRRLLHWFWDFHVCCNSRSKLNICLPSSVKFTIFLSLHFFWKDLNRDKLTKQKKLIYFSTKYLTQILDRGVENFYFNDNLWGTKHSAVSSIICE